MSTGLPRGSRGRPRAHGVRTAPPSWCHSYLTEGVCWHKGHACRCQGQGTAGRPSSPSPASSLSLLHLLFLCILTPLPLYLLFLLFRVLSLFLLCIPSPFPIPLSSPPLSIYIRFCFCFCFSNSYFPHFLLLFLLVCPDLHAFWFIDFVSFSFLLLFPPFFVPLHHLF